MRTLVNLNPVAEVRAMEEMFERLLGPSTRPSGTPSNGLAIDVLERDGKLVIRAAIPGIDREQLDIQVEENVLTIRGETRSDAESKDEKVYRREIVTGRFVRSIRLPEGLDFQGIDAEFRNGIVTIHIPRLAEVKPKALKVAVRNAEAAAAVDTEETNA